MTMKTLFEAGHRDGGTPSPWRVGLVGAGRIVERAHLPLLCEMPGVQVAGVFDPDRDRASALAGRFGVPKVCASLNELFDVGLDIALVACPNHLHASTSIAALEANLHVLCEKPMALSLVEAGAMVAAAESAGRELMIAFANRFRPEVVALRRAVQEQQLGQIKSIRCGWLRRQGIPGAGTWFTRQASAGGGVLTDLGSHMLDLALWLGGHPRLLGASCALDGRLNPQAQASWYASTTQEGAVCDVEISASGFLVCEGPLDIFVEVSWDSAVPYDQTYLHVIGAQGMARLETLFGFSPLGHRPAHPLRLWREGQPVTHPAAAAADLLQPYRDQWRFFLDHLRTPGRLRELLPDNLAAVRAIEMLYRSAESLPPPEPAARPATIV
jgi:predicted dehydrogenase